jgi:hypothetical protein
MAKLDIDWTNSDWWKQLQGNLQPPETPQETMDRLYGNYTPTPQLPTTPVNTKPVQRVRNPFTLGSPISAENQGQTVMSQALRQMAATKAADSGTGGSE